LVDDDAYTTVCSLTLSTSVSEKLPSIEGVFSLAQSRHADRGRLNFFVKIEPQTLILTMNRPLQVVILINCLIVQLPYKKEKRLLIFCPSLVFLMSQY
jgi:hypothetical protein